jgi:hypothetical protein
MIGPVGVREILHAYQKAPHVIAGELGIGRGDGVVIQDPQPSPAMPS